MDIFVLCFTEINQQLDLLDFGIFTQIYKNILYCFHQDLETILKYCVNYIEKNLEKVRNLEREISKSPEKKNSDTFGFLRKTQPQPEQRGSSKNSIVIGNNDDMVRMKKKIDDQKEYISEREQKVITLSHHLKLLQNQLQTANVVNTTLISHTLNKKSEQIVYINNEDNNSNGSKSEEKRNIQKKGNTKNFKEKHMNSDKKNLEKNMGNKEEQVYIPVMLPDFSKDINNVQQDLVFEYNQINKNEEEKEMEDPLKIEMEILLYKKEENLALNRKSNEATDELNSILKVMNSEYKKISKTKSFFLVFLLILYWINFFYNFIYLINFKFILCFYKKLKI